MSKDYRDAILCAKEAALYNLKSQLVLAIRANKDVLAADIQNRIDTLQKRMSNATSATR